MATHSSAADASVVAKPTLTTELIGGALGIVAAVALPQVFHLVGIASGTGNVPGTVWLPMHLPVIFVGLLLGWRAGLMTGLAAPLISFALTGMPPAVLLPFMVIELAAYGAIAGLLREVKLANIWKVLIVQIGGRLIRAVAIVAGVYLFGSKIKIETIWNSIAVGLPGLILQWTFIPLLVFYIQQRAPQRFGLPRN